MKIAKCVLIVVSLALLSGCIIGDDGGDRGFDHGQGEFHDQGRGQDHGGGQDRR